MSGRGNDAVACAVIVSTLLCGLIGACGSKDPKKTVRPGPEYQSGGDGGVATTAGAAAVEIGGLGGSAGGPTASLGGQAGAAEAPVAGQGASAGAGRQGESPDDSLRAYYPFSGDALDASGYGNDCTTGSATLQADRHGVADSAYHFDGTSTSYLSCGNDTSLDVTGPLTLAAWFKPETASLSGLNRALIAKWFPPDQRSYALLIQNENQTSLDLCDGTHGLSMVVDPIGTGALPAGTVCDDAPVAVDVWQHAAAVLEPGERISLYLNGALVRELVEESVVSAASVSTTPLLLGRNNLGYFVGAIDEARVYARALSAQDVTALATQ